MRKDAAGMAFESYAHWIMSSQDYDVSTKKKKKRKKKKNIQKRFQVKKTKMKIVSINKAQFAGLNDKRYCFLDGMVSFPYGHPKLKNVRKKKK